MATAGQLKTPFVIILYFLLEIKFQGQDSMKGERETEVES